MAKIDSLVNVAIQLGTTAIAGKSFSDMLILGKHKLSGGRVMIVTDANELLEMGLDSSDPLYKAVATAFAQVSHIAQVYVGRQDDSETVTDALAACSKEFNNWYGLALSSRVKEDVLFAAMWAEANSKLFVTASSDEGIVTASVSNDLASQCKTSNYYRTAVMYSHKADEEYPEIAMMSHCFTFYPGAETWNLKKLSAVSHSPLTETEFNAAKTKNVTTFENFNDSFSITQGGKVAGGEWIDVIRFRDWLMQEVQINTTSTLINANGKLPYTDAGIEMVGQAIRQALDLGVVRGGISPVEYDKDSNEIPSYRITLPRSADISANNKANRLLQDVKFTARLAGAIHIAEIKGYLSYNQ
ncbi:DUF3383 family protein [Actinobacillus pleuropneumoniae]|uniref:DUF3383 family protein n=1 Tax=Actinobacillus pleuropneumoniae TaxID=715 RepID=UPI003F7BA186